MSAFLPFEKGLAELEGQIAELRANAQAEEGLEIEDEIRQLEQRVEARLDEIYGRLTPWQRCQIARHPGRPHSTDFAAALFEEFLPLAGDRAFAEDFAIVGGLVRFRGSVRRVHRPGEGPRHGVPDPAEFRHGAAGGLPQGDPADGTR